MGVLVMRVLLLGVHIKALVFWNLPCHAQKVSLRVPSWSHQKATLAALASQNCSLLFAVRALAPRVAVPPQGHDEGLK